MTGPADAPGRGPAGTAGSPPSARGSDRRFRYEIDGQGPPILFLNGLFQSTPSWQFVREHLPAGFTHIRLDFPNQGPGAADPAYAAFAAYCDFVEDFLAARRIRPEDLVVVGFSFGAEVARALALDRSVRFRALVLGSVSPPGLGRFWREWFTNLGVVADRGDVELFVRLIAFHMYSPAFFQRFGKAMAVMKMRYTQYFGEDPDSLRLLARAPLSRDFEREQRDEVFDVPVHIISPTHDNLVPHDMSAAHAAHIGARHHSVEAGHTFIVEAPAATADIVAAALDDFAPPRCNTAKGLTC